MSWWRRNDQRIGGGLVVIGLGVLAAAVTAQPERVWSNPYFVGAVASVCAGVLLFAVGLRTKDPDEARIKRFYKIANRVRDADHAKKYDKLRRPSPLGFNQTVARHIEHLESRHWWHRRLRRPYTNRVHRRFVSAVEELAHRGLQDAHLTYYVKNPPEKYKRWDAAVTLVHLAEQLPGGIVNPWP